MFQLITKLAMGKNNDVFGCNGVDGPFIKDVCSQEQGDKGGFPDADVRIFLRKLWYVRTDKVGLKQLGQREWESTFRDFGRMSFTNIEQSLV